MAYNGVERRGQHPPRRGKKTLAWTAVVAALSGLGGGAKALWDNTERRAAAVASAVTDSRLSGHDRELVEIRQSLRDLQQGQRTMAVDLAKIAARQP